MKKIVLIILFIFINANALYLSSEVVKNATTLLVVLDEKGVSNPKLTFDKLNIEFYPYPNRDSFYALIPISYYEKPGDKKLIISYFKNNEKIFKGVNFKVIDGDYKSEVINVEKGKITLSEKNKVRTQKEYNEAISMYKKSSLELFTYSDYTYPLNSKITSDFGKKRVYNGSFKSYHSGTDYKALNGTPIKAVNNGIVTMASDRFYAGNSIVINHGNGIYSCYFHLSKMNFKVGQSIKKGEILGLSGSTGRVTGPHLHFAFRVHGTIVDPLHFIQLLNNYKLY